jgi:RNA methyltransferase, TrmH family
MHEKPSPSALLPAAQIARLCSLRRDRARRDHSKLFVIEGIRQFIQACDEGFAVDTIFVSPVLLQQGIACKLVRRVTAGGARKVVLTPEQFRGISTTERASGVAAIVRQRWTPLVETPIGGTGWLVIDTIRSPGNLGTILRTAEAVGMSGVIFASPAVDPYDPLVVRASMGGIFHIPLTRTTPRELGFWLAAREVDLIGLSPTAPRLWTDLPASPGGHAIAVGDERTGLSPPLRRLCDTQVKLPMPGRADSLNVAVAAGVMMYELVRRKA